jgi:hypothetical protein
MRDERIGVRKAETTLGSAGLAARATTADDPTMGVGATGDVLLMGVDTTADYLLWN